MIKAEGIQKNFGRLQVLKGIDLEIGKGEIVTIVGDSGAGKTTLLHILGTLDKPDSGRLEINGNRIDTLRSNALSKFRNKNIGFVFQFHHLLPEFTALENVCIPAWIAKENKKSAMQRAKELLDLLKLSERFEHKPSQLSGGEQQRVAVARALINNPAVIFADEPSGNLDSKNAEDLHKLFFDLRQSYNQTFVIVTHNKELANQSDRTLTIKDGLIL
ncbi:MAG: ABC transporter ATP-binding protein [Bacteroidia bacterium]|nr:ABC transporter ATP-binding protein [Bacteroidia bacterium]MCO5255015.1 ABC transporter ATP-binding protein [Bacteroidota bacterium]